MTSSLLLPDELFYMKVQGKEKKKEKDKTQSKLCGLVLKFFIAERP